VQECVFDAARLRDLMKRRLAAAGVLVRLGIVASAVELAADGLVVKTETEALHARQVYSCVYSETNALLQRSGLPLLPFKHEIAEMALVRLPEPLAGLGITVVDGPFWSCLPYPTRSAHTLTHVRYTPHESWHDQAVYHDPGARFEPHIMETTYPYMIRDAARHVPAFARAEYIESLYTVKTVLSSNEADDGRPILYRRDYGLPGFSDVLGSKIDNVYDVLTAVGSAEPALAPA